MGDYMIEIDFYELMEEQIENWKIINREIRLIRITMTFILIILISLLFFI